MEMPITINIPVAWGDLDHFGHVNNVVYFRYFQDARIAYFKHIGLMDLYKDTKMGPILHSTAANFQKELGYPDDIVIGAKVSSMRSSSFVLDYAIESASSGSVATGNSVIVMLDFNTKQKIPIPEAIRAEICKLEQKKF